MVARSLLFSRARSYTPPLNWQDRRGLCQENTLFICGETVGSSRRGLSSVCILPCPRVSQQPCEWWWFQVYEREPNYMQLFVLEEPKRFLLSTLVGTLLRVPEGFNCELRPFRGFPPPEVFLGCSLYSSCNLRWAFPALSASQEPGNGAARRNVK